MCSKLTSLEQYGVVNLQREQHGKGGRLNTMGGRFTEVE
jgi:hypothetical protein